MYFSSVDVFSSVIVPDSMFCSVLIDVYLKKHCISRVWRVLGLVVVLDPMFGGVFGGVCLTNSRQ